jgi:predicted Zn-dependent protease
MVRRPFAQKLYLRALVPALISASFAACATNPVTGDRELSLMSEAQEIQTGRELDAEVRRQMGIYRDAALQQYVNDIGLRLARTSHRPNIPWHFAVVDQPAVNAFALPGGYIYITRGILPYLSNEAELAGVLGHEIGHVTARHSAAAYSKATSAGVGLALLGIFVPSTRPLQGVAETALGVLFLKHGRDDELQADRLGVEYSAKGGWDPEGIAGMLTTLARIDDATGSRRGVPNWLATHPAPADRVQQVRASVAQAKTSVPAQTRARDEAQFLTRIDGIVYGDSPEQGIVRGNSFLHADMRFELRFPEGWEIQNAPSQVAAKAPGEEAYMLLQLAQEASGSLESIAVGGMRNAGLRQVDGGRATINGLEAYVGTYQGTMQGVGEVIVRAAHIAHERRVFIFAGLAPGGVYDRVERSIAQSLRSFEPLSREEAARIQPNRIDLYTVRQGDTWQSIAKRSGEGNVPATTLAIMNNYDVNQEPRPGDRIKIVVSG